MANTAQAQLRYLRIAPRKVRFVAASVRGLSVNEAEAQLMLQPRRAAVPLLKLLRSAVANAKAGKLNTEALYIKTFTVDNGPFLKRFMPRARGSASEIQKKMSHVTLVLAEKEGAKAPRFTITVVKKEKKPEGEAKKKRSPEAVREEKAAKGEKRRGVMQKVFHRKTAAGD